MRQKAKNKTSFAGLTAPILLLFTIKLVNSPRKTQETGCLNLQNGKTSFPVNNALCGFTEFPVPVKPFSHLLLMT
jgi:hypothetical protein